MFNRALALTRKLGFPDVILPGEAVGGDGGARRWRPEARWLGGGRGGGNKNRRRSRIELHRMQVTDEKREGWNEKQGWTPGLNSDM